MIAWWWIAVLFPFAFSAGFWFCGRMKAHVFQENMDLRNEVERLHRRIHLIGERRLDGTLDNEKRNR